MTQLTLTGGFANKTLFEQAGVALPGDERHLGRLGRRRRPRSRASQSCPPPSPSTAPATASPARTSPTAPTTSAPDGSPAPVDEGVKDLRREARRLDRRRHDAQGHLGLGRRLDLSRRAPTTSSTPRSPSTIPAAGRSPTSRPRSATTSTGSPPARPAAPPPAPACRAAPALVAIKYTKNPEEVAKVMDYLASEPIVKEFTERTLFLPAHKGVIADGGLNFKTDDPNVKPALETFVDGLAASRSRRRAAAGLEMGRRLLRRAGHPHQPGDGRRADARRRLSRASTRTSPTGRRRPSSQRPGARCATPRPRRLGRRRRSWRRSAGWRGLLDPPLRALQRADGHERHGRLLPGAEHADLRHLRAVPARSSTSSIR